MNLESLQCQLPVPAQPSYIEVSDSSLKAMNQSATMAAAIREIEQLILREYPDAVFEVELDEDSGATWVTVEADFDDNHWDDVVDVYIGRLLDIQDEWELWLHFMPISTRDRDTRSVAA